MTPEINNDAVQIATHIVNGDSTAAKELFNQIIYKKDLKHFECIVLKDRAFEIVGDHEKTGAPLSSYFVTA